MKKHVSTLRCIVIVLISMLLSVSALAQERITVTGTVTDHLGALSGTSVMVVGTDIGVLTDMDGKYTLDNVPIGSTLEFSFMGYVKQDVVVRQNVINIVLEEDSTLLEELVVVGYGTVKKSDLTGSVASIGEEAMTKTATSDALQAIQGRAAGVQIITATGDPAATAEIKIRGTGSPNGSSPLYVVDGFPMNDINYLSPTDIASIEILKDASATAIYGSRGANGVVMITTKKGERGAVKTKINVEYGIEALPVRPEMLNATEYAEMVNKTYANSGLQPVYASTNLGEGTDWYDEVMRVGRYQNYNATISGGTDKINTMFSTTFFKRDGTVKSTEFQRINFTQNTTMHVTSFLKLNASISGSFAKNNSLGANGTNNNTIFLSSLIAPPDVPVWDEATDYYSGISVFRLANPAGVISRNFGESKRNNLIGNFSADLKIFDGLTFTSRFGYRYNTNLSSNYSPIYYETSNISDLIDTVSRGTSVTTDWTWENMLTYSKEWEKHSLTALVAMSAREYRSESYSASKQGLPSSSEFYHYFNAATSNPLASGSASELAMLSYLGRINYNLLDRYLITASMRADGSSRFLGKNRWGYFPSAAFAWKISSEPFFEGIKDVVNEAKFRIGWGQIGNERISSYYPYMTGMSQQQYYTIGTSKDRVNGSLPSGIGNPSVQWETSEQFNIGLDLSFLSDKLSFTADYYIRKTNDILLSQSVPNISGFSSMTRNVGGMENRGVELAITWKDKAGDFGYSISGNVSFNKNLVTNLGTSNYLSSSFAYDYALIDLQGQFSNVIRSEVGQPYAQFWGYEFMGIFQNQSQIDNYKSADGKVIMPKAKPGDSIYADLNGDGKISADDMTFIGSPHPTAIFGLTFNADWKNFDLSLLFQGVAGNEIFNASKFYFSKFDGRQNVLKSAYMTAWDGEGTSNTVPIMIAQSAENSRISQNWWQSTNYIEDGSYVRLKNLQLGYTFKTKIKKLSPSFRVFLSAQNLFTITGYSGIDPEIPDNGIDRGQYPQPRTFMIGANINF